MDGANGLNPGEDHDTQTDFDERGRSDPQPWRTMAAAQAQQVMPPPGNDPGGYYSQNDQDGYYDRDGHYRRIQDQDS